MRSHGLARLALALTLSACATANTSKESGGRDGAVASDDAASSADDLSAGNADLAGAADDLGGGPDDAATTVDAVTSPDLALTPAADLTSPVDAAAPDLARDAAAADLAPPRDLSLPPDLKPCVPSCPTGWCGGDGCGNSCTCGAGQTCAGTVCQTIPHTYASPGLAPSFWNGAYGKPLHNITLAADDPQARIYYTTDGSAPSLSSTNGSTPLQLDTLAALTPATGATTAQLRLRYFAASPTGGQESPHDDLYKTDTTLQANSGSIAPVNTLAASNGSPYYGSPTMVVAAGQKLPMASSEFRLWAQNACPMCRVQLVYAVGTTYQGCLYDGLPGVYPGYVDSSTATPPGPVIFTVTAPTRSGRYDVTLTMYEQTSCMAALADPGLSASPRVYRIAELIVP